MNEEQQKRAQAFLDEYEELTKKHNMDFANYPMYIPDGQGAFRTIIQSTPVDTSNMPTKSPFVTE